MDSPSDDTAVALGAGAAEDALAHFGVKGMKWGVRRTATQRYADRYGAEGKLSNTKNTPAARAAAREKVKAGTATLGEAHVAGLKSTGHRVANGVLGDKRFWTSTAKIAGLGYAGLAASQYGPELLPTSFVKSIGDAGWSVLTGTRMGPSGSYTTVDGSTTMTTEKLGKAALTIAGATATGAAAATAVGATAVSNVTRAATGNTRISRSYGRLGSQMAKRQTEGAKRVNKTLRKSGSIRRGRLKHDDLSLEHAGVTVKDSLAALTLEQRQTVDLIIGAAFEDVDISGVDGVASQYEALPVDIQHIIDFVVGTALDEEMGLEHSDSVDDFLAHYGVKGMKWGVIRRRSSKSSTPLSDDAAAARATLSKSARSSSNADLQAALARMQLEAKVLEVQTSMVVPSRLTRAKRFVGSLLGEIGANETNRIAKGAAAVAVEAALRDSGKVKLNKEFAVKVADRIKPKKGK